MSKANYQRLLIIFVSAVGLTSCKRDAGGRPPATARAANSDFPITVRQKLNYDLNSWQQLYDRSLELGEAIDLGQPAPPYTEIHATCGEGPREVNFKTNFTNEQIIPVFRFVPEDLLVRDLKAVPADCHFIIQMSQDNVQKFGHEMTARVTGDHGGVAMSGLWNHRGGRPMSFSRKLLGKRLKFNGRGKEKLNAQLICRDATFNTLDFDGERDLNDFTVEHPAIRDEKDISVPLRDRTDQLCRVVLKDKAGSGRAEMTTLFNVRFKDSHWDVAHIHDTRSKTGTMALGESYPLATYDITNSDTTARQFRFNKDWYNSNLRLNLKYDPNAVQSIFGPAWSRIFKDGPTGLLPLGPGEVFVVQPGQTQRVYLMYTVGGDIHCDYLRVRVKMTDDLYIQDLSPDGNVLSVTKLEAPPETSKVQFQPSFVFHDEDEHPGEGCYW